MGNTSNPKQWATMERMRFIERSAYWRGSVNRQDLQEVFGLSKAQSSADLQKYQEENPGALGYNMKRKRYEGALEMVSKFTVPVLEEAMAIFLKGGSSALTVASMAGQGRANGPLQVYVVPMPQRRAPFMVERRIFQSVLHGFKLQVRYFSVNSGREDWRWLHPKAFAHDGNRWHVRAWCESREGWADFTLSRIVEARLPEISGVSLEADPKEKRATLNLRPHHGLNGTAKEAVERDFGMDDGELKFSASGIVADYLRSRLGVPLADGSFPAPLVEEV